MTEEPRGGIFPLCEIARMHGMFDEEIELGCFLSEYSKYLCNFTPHFSLHNRQ